jgi:hypothetical protein
MPKLEPEARIKPVQSVLAGLLLLWRVAGAPASMLWRDWVMVLAIYWLAISLRPRAPFRPTLTLTAMSYLLGIYIAGQAPHTLTALGLK